MESDSSTQRSKGGGHCGVSAEQGGAVMKILSGTTASALVTRLAARSHRLESVEPQVQQIIRAVRRGGDRALRRYAERWDGLAPRQALRVSPTEIKKAWQSVS